MANPPVFTIFPNPHWVIIDNFSRLPDGAAIYTYRHKNPSEFKPAFQDAAGTIPYGQPIVGFGNGTMPPIYWEFDPANPDETYYIRVYDSADPVNQQFLWDFDGLSGNSGSGGGTVVSAYNIENFVVNNVFYNNCGNVAGTPSVPAFITLAPSNNKGFVGTPNAAFGSPAPDICFIKDVTTATDAISFINFTPLGINALFGDITPVQYLRYVCSGIGAGETYKYVQFPISKSVQNLSQQEATVKIYARCNSGNTTLVLSWRQFYGDNGGSADKIEIIATITLTNNWQSFLFSSIIPDASGATLGDCHNDALFLQVNYPLSDLTSIDIIKPAVYLGKTAPFVDYVTYDEIEAVTSIPRTGDFKQSQNNVIFGWVKMDDGTIGSPGSGSTNRANIDTFPLFHLLWTNNLSSQLLAPMFTAAGAPVAYGASSSADFSANNRISLTRTLGRVLAGTYTPTINQAFTNLGNIMTVISTAGFNTGAPVVALGFALPVPLVNNTTYYAIKLSPTTMSLATTAINALLGIPIVLTTNAGGNVQVPAHQLGAFLGDETHTLIPGELPNPLTAGAFSRAASFGVDFFAIEGGGAILPSSISNLGGNQPHTIMQPTAYVNFFMKL